MENEIIMPKAGDYVVLLVDEPDENRWLHTGDTGVVLRVDEEEIVMVDWQRDVSGHTCGGMCDSGHGWNVVMSDVSVIHNDFYDDSKLDVNIEINCFLFGGQ